VLYCPYFPHIFGYIEKAEKSKNILILRYEDMKENPAREVAKVMKFLEINLTDEDVDDIVKQTSFESMKSNPTTNYSQWDSLGIRDKNESNFMRKGDFHTPIVFGISQKTYEKFNSSINFCFPGSVGDYKNFIDSDFDLAFDNWIVKNLTAAGKMGFNFIFSLNSKDSNLETEQLPEKIDT